MKTNFKAVGCLIIVALLATAAGCGISKDKYDALLDDKIMLEERVSLVAKAKDALKREYDNLLAEKLDLSTQLDTAINEKAAMKAEYDKILDEKIALKAAYDKLLAENKALQR